MDPIGSLRKYVTGYKRFDRELDAPDGQHKIHSGLYEDDAGNVFVHIHPEEKWIDLEHFTQARLVAARGPVAVSPANARLGLVYAASFSQDVAVYAELGVTPIVAHVSAPNQIAESPWIELAELARADVYVAVVGWGGDGKDDPVFGSVLAEFR